MLMPPLSEGDERLRDFIVRTRIEAGLSQDDVARLGGISRNTLAGIEVGNSTPNHRSLPKIAKGLGVPPEKLERIRAGLNPETPVDARALAEAIAAKPADVRDTLARLLELPEDLLEAYVATAQAFLRTRRQG